MSIQEKLIAFMKDPTMQPYPILEYTLVTPTDITFSENVRRACEVNYCGRYGKSWTCPPGAGKWEELREHYHSYQHALVYTTRHELEDSFDLEGMNEGSAQHYLVDEAVLDLIADEAQPHELSGAGSCSICEKCTYPDAPCRFPDRARRSMEACGIDVVTLSKDCGLHYMNGVDTVTYFSIVFW